MHLHGTKSWARLSCSATGSIVGGMGTRQSFSLRLWRRRRIADNVTQIHIANYHEGGREGARAHHGATRAL